MCAISEPVKCHRCEQCSCPCCRVGMEWSRASLLQLPSRKAPWGCPEQAGIQEDKVCAASGLGMAVIWMGLRTPAHSVSLHLSGLLPSNAAWLCKACHVIKSLLERKLDLRSALLQREWVLKKGWNEDSFGMLSTGYMNIKCPHLGEYTEFGAAPKMGSREVKLSSCGFSPHLNSYKCSVQ